MSSEFKLIDVRQFVLAFLGTLFLKIHEKSDATFDSL